VQSEELDVSATLTIIDIWKQTANEVKDIVIQMKSHDIPGRLAESAAAARLFVASRVPSLPLVRSKQLNDLNISCNCVLYVATNVMHDQYVYSSLFYGLLQRTLIHEQLQLRDKIVLLNSFRYCQYALVLGSVSSRLSQYVIKRVNSTFRLAERYSPLARDC